MANNMTAKFIGMALSTSDILCRPDGNTIVKMLDMSAPILD